MDSSGRGCLFVLSGPSGAGKGTVIKRVLAARRDTFFSVSMTTRAPRPGEVDGVSYIFTDRERFSKLISEGGLLEYAEYVGNFYGTPLEPIDRQLSAGKDVILDIETAGAMNVKKLRDDAILIFLTPSKLSEVERRLRGRRTESDADIEKRLEKAKKEFGLIPEYRYLVINDNLATAISELMAIMDAENCRAEKRKNLVQF